MDGRGIREELVQGTGGDPGAPGFPGRLREGIRERLPRDRGAGTVDARVGWGDAADDERAAARVRSAAALFPAAWIERANRTPLHVVSNGKRWGGRIGR